MGALEEYDSEFDRRITLASILATYEFATQHDMQDLQDGVIDTYCKLFDIPEPLYLIALGISLPNGEEDYH